MYNTCSFNLNSHRFTDSIKLIIAGSPDVTLIKDAQYISISHLYTVQDLQIKSRKCKYSTKIHYIFPLKLKVTNILYTYKIH